MLRHIINFKWHLNKIKLNHTFSTIYALSSGWGKCGVSIIRVSGPKSFTGEDCCEFHIHGSSAVQKAVFKSLESMEGVGIAQPGEFIKRAFYNGKMDLIEVEGLADLIKSETEQQRRAALRIVGGELKSLYHCWRNILIKNQADIEMLIDFSEEHHIEILVEKKILTEINNLHVAINSFLKNSMFRGERLANGFRITLVGSPNVGKSTLFNILCQSNGAIVSPIPGTTRDVLNVSKDLGGYPVIYADTAGIRKFLGGEKRTIDESTIHLIEEEGIIRAKDTISQSDILLVMLEAPKISFSKKSRDTLSIIKYWQDTVEKYVRNELTLDYSLFHKGGSLKVKNANTEINLDKHTNIEKRILFIVNKCDLLVNHVNEIYEDFDYVSNIFENLIFTSCKNKKGVQRLIKYMIDILVEMCGDSSKGDPFVHSQRQRNSLAVCDKYLKNFLETEFIEHNYVYLARTLQRASRNLSLLAGDAQGGVITTEDVLDIVFKDFCVGK
ncbi:unnamed protein product [Gordionus sp. m RMFG-2023]|uniref:tRNA modification GTPase GTPBP3, mitochondrial-like isoform X2 n=1 Tax=Gordionus sp. m RMFG-2023 TaxID=3053472 RepID=UPI0030E49E2F